MTHRIQLRTTKPQARDLLKAFEAHLDANGATMNPQDATFLSTHIHVIKAALLTQQRGNKVVLTLRVRNDGDLLIARDAALRTTNTSVDPSAKGTVGILLESPAREMLASVITCRWTELASTLDRVNDALRRGEAVDAAPES